MLVKQVKNKTRVLRIRVTGADIKKGVRNNSSRCPIARAVKRGAKTPQIKVDGLWCDKLSPGKNRYGFRWLMESGLLSKKAQRFVKRFDSKLPVKPFSFTLRMKKAQ